MSTKEMWEKIFFLLFVSPILGFAIVMIYLDCARYVDVGKWGYAFFGSIVTGVLTYFIRKKPKADNK